MNNLSQTSTESYYDENVSNKIDPEYGLSEEDFLHSSYFDENVSPDSDPDYDIKKLDKEYPHLLSLAVEKEKPAMKEMSETEILQRAIEIIQKSQEEPEIKPEISELGKTFKCVASKEDIGQMLVSIRKELGLSQGAVAKRMNLKQPAVAKVENAHTNPNLETLQKFSQAVGAKLEISFVIPEHN